MIVRNANRLQAIVAPIVSLCSLVLVWTLLVRTTNLPPFILPSPFAVFADLWQNRTLVLESTLYTMQAVLIGIFVATLVALIGALVMDLVPLLKKALYPLIVVSQTIQILAIAPLIILWIGFGSPATIAIVVLFCFFPIVIALVEGFRRIPIRYMHQFHSMGATSLQTWWHLRIRYALPSLCAGLRIAVTYSVVAATIGEWVGGTRGLGLYILRAKNALQTPRLFGGMVAITMLSIVLFVAVVALERVLIPWHTTRANKANKIVWRLQGSTP